MEDLHPARAHSPRMPNEVAVFLKPGTKIEPLAFGWYAWIHLIPPVQRALNLTYRQLPLLESFIRTPDVHVAANADAALYGGPFVQIAAQRVEDIRALVSVMRDRATRHISFARDLKELDKKLQKSATGFSMSDFYADIPDSLLGLVEFLYDLNDHPRIRICEELAYDELSQECMEEIVISNVPERSRLFFMNTPRLSHADELRLPISFADERIDDLCRMRTHGKPLRELLDRFELPDGDDALFAAFVTATPPPRRSPNYAGGNVRLRYFGHACVLVQSRDTSILVDPMFAWENDGSDNRFTFCDLPDTLDYVVLSHAHQDHCSPEMLIQIRHRTDCIVVPRNNSGNVADPSLTLALRKLGFKRILSADPFDGIDFADGRITSLPFPGEHVDLDVHSRQGIHIDIAGRKFAFLVDSDGRDSHVFRHVARRMGKKIDALFIGMECHGAPLSWLYGPLLTKPVNRRNDESRRLSGLDSSRAWSTIQQFDVAQVFVYAMGQEPWLKHVMGLEYSPESIQLKEVARLLDKCASAGIPAENLFTSREIEL
jgi:L-ascorbate metabolism protein UlaG (beta-lactamase superfamily)